MFEFLNDILIIFAQACAQLIDINLPFEFPYAEPLMQLSLALLLLMVGVLAVRLIHRMDTKIRTRKTAGRKRRRFKFKRIRFRRNHNEI